MPFTISSADHPRFDVDAYMSSKRNATTPSPSSSEMSRVGDIEDECLITFRFREGTEPTHEESWHTRLLLQNAIIAWGNCIKYEEEGEGRWGRIVPRPESQVLRLSIEVRVVRRGGAVVDG